MNAMMNKEQENALTKDVRQMSDSELEASLKALRDLTVEMVTTKNNIVKFRKKAA